MKNERHAKILELIEQYAIDRQEDLLEHLNQAGFKVTQATVSRDIRQLHLVKAAAGGQAMHSQSRFETIFRESVLKVDYAGHMVVVKCFSGMANAACELFDSIQWEYEVVGTLSGDDTFLILMRTEGPAAICGALGRYVANG